MGLKSPKSAENGAKTAIFHSKVRESDPESRESTGIDAAKVLPKKRERAVESTSKVPQSTAKDAD